MSESGFAPVGFLGSAAGWEAGLQWVFPVLESTNSMLVVPTTKKWSEANLAEVPDGFEVTPIETDTLVKEGELFVVLGQEFRLHADRARLRIGSGWARSNSGFDFKVLTPALFDNLVARLYRHSKKRFRTALARDLVEVAVEAACVASVTSSKVDRFEPLLMRAFLAEWIDDDKSMMRAKDLLFDLGVQENDIHDWRYRIACSVGAIRSSLKRSQQESEPSGDNYSEFSENYWSSLLSQGTADIARAVDSQLAPSGLSYAEFEVLDALGRASDGIMQLSHLASHLNLTQSGTARRMEGVLQHGWVERFTGPRNRRTINVRLTSTGRDRLGSARPLIAGIVRTQFLDILTLKELTLLISATLKLRRFNGEEVAQNQHGRQSVVAAHNETTST